MNRIQRGTLWSVLATAALADALLAPFLPRFFEETFAADAVLSPGLYVASSRLAVALALPLWAKWARKYVKLEFIAVLLALAGIFGVASAFAPGLKTFIGVSFLAEAMRASYLLLYPLLIDDTPLEKRGGVVAAGAALINAAALVAAFAGASLLEAFGGRAVVIVSGAVDLLLILPLVVLARRLRQAPATTSVVGTPAAALSEATALPPVAESAPTASQASVPFAFWAFVAVGFLSTFAYILLRPHFSLFIEQTFSSDIPLWQMGALYVLPSAAAVLAMPFMGRWLNGDRANAALIVSSLVLAATAWAQGTSTSWTLFLVSRLVHGLSLYVLEVSLEYAALARCADAFGRFSWVNSLQQAAMVGAPLLASVLVHQGFGVLFAVATLIAGLAAVAAWVATRPERRSVLSSSVQGAVS